MYRKKTVLLCSVHNPTLKPVGIAVLVADGRKTAVRVSAKGLPRQDCYIWIEADGVSECAEFCSATGVEFFLPPLLLEKVTCLLLDSDFSALCFGSSRGRVMTAQTLTLAVQSAKNKKNPTTEAVFEQSEQSGQKIQEKTEQKTNGQEETRQKEEDKQPKPLVFDGDYEKFVLATANYYGEKKFEQTDSAEQRAKVSLAEYAKALENFYDKGKKSGYLAEVGKELEKVFEDYSPYLPLMRKIEDSFFVRITDGKGNFFALGLLQEEGVPTYICYALPKTTAEETGFLTVSVAEEGGNKDFCLILQSAKDGKVFKAVA